MRIDTNNKVIYFSNPKTGSTSLRVIMDKYCNFPLLKKTNEIENNEHKSANKYDLIFQILNKENDTKIYLTEYFSFTTIRNPWDRVVSSFKYQKCDKNGHAWYDVYHDKNTAGEYSFSEFLKDVNDKEYWCGIGVPNAS